MEVIASPGEEKKQICVSLCVCVCLCACVCVFAFPETPHHLPAAFPSHPHLDLLFVKGLPFAFSHSQVFKTHHLTHIFSWKQPILAPPCLTHLQSYTPSIHLLQLRSLLSDLFLWLQPCWLCSFWNFQAPSLPSAFLLHLSSAWYVLPASNWQVGLSSHHQPDAIDCCTCFLPPRVVLIPFNLAVFSFSP